MACKLRVWGDHNVCVGYAMCETIAPQMFQFNANALNPAGDTVEKILEAAENSPVRALFVEDAETHGPGWCPAGRPGPARARPAQDPGENVATVNHLPI